MQTIFQLPGSLSAPLPVVSGAAAYPPFEGAGEDEAFGEANVAGDGLDGILRGLQQVAGALPAPAGEVLHGTAPQFRLTNGALIKNTAA